MGIMLKGKFAWIAEAAAGLILFLLPLKFGTLVAIPNLTMIYWSDPVSLFIGAWPAPVFPVCASLFLLLSLLLIPGEIFSGRAGKFSGLWLLLGLAALPGGIATGTPPDAFAYFISYVLSVGAFLLGFVRVVNHNPKLIGIFHGLFTFSFLIFSSSTTEKVSFSRFSSFTPSILSIGFFDISSFFARNP